MRVVGVEQQKMIELRQKHICNAPKHLLKRQWGWFVTHVFCYVYKKECYQNCYQSQACAFLNAAVVAAARSSL